MYRITGFKADADDQRDLTTLLSQKTGTQVTEINILKRSIDARNRERVLFVYTIDFECTGRPRGKNISEAPAREIYETDMKYMGSERPVIAGFGPAGMFAALILAEAGARPIVLERGKAADERARDVERFFTEGILDPESNVSFGEGGAGTFSDGKLVTGIKDRRKDIVFDRLIAAGAPEETAWLQKPHIGTDLLRDIVVNIRKRIETLGGEVRFRSRMTDISYTADGIKAVTVNGNEKLECRDLILALGHSARDTFAMLRDSGMYMERKPFSIGVRIEHDQQMIDEALYGRFSRYLPHAEYKMSRRCANGRGAYTFCMCPGGMVIPAATEEGYAVTNGMSYHDRSSGRANSALLVDVRPSDFTGDDVLAGVEFQRKYERAAYLANGYDPIEMTWYGYKDDEGNILDRCLPSFVRPCYLEAVPAFGRQIEGFDGPGAVLKGIETRSSSPVRILRDEKGMSSIRGIYPCGEGAGYAGGITSAAVDGIRIAELVLSKYLW